MTLYKRGSQYLRVIQDSDPESPREWDSLGTMYCMHRRYNLGDVQLKSSDYNSWEEVKKSFNTKENAVVLPLYLMDHSGLTLQTKPFGGINGHFDSGQVGFIVATKKEIRKNFGIKNVTKKYIKQVTEMLVAEVEIYNQFLSGDVYGYEHFEIDSEGNENNIHSCWGFFGDDIATNGMLDHIEGDASEWVEVSESELETDTDNDD